MADFAKFGSGAIDMACALAGNMDQAAVADFLVYQQRLLQEKVISDRVEKKKADASKGSGTATSGNPAVTGRAHGAMARMKAQLASKR